MTREEHQNKIYKQEHDLEVQEKVIVLIKILVAIVLVIVLTYLYGKYVGAKFLVVNEYKIESSKLDESFNGFKIVHISDINYNGDKKLLEKSIKKIKELRPDLLVFTGDLVYEEYTLKEDDTNKIIELLSSIETSAGKYAIYGNNDLRVSNIRTILEESNFNILNNHNDLIYYNGDNPINIIGIETMYHDLYKINGEDYYNDMFNILLLHEPDIVKELTYDPDIILAGHSLNGLIRIPKVGCIYRPKGANTYCDKYYKLKNSELFISGGIGTNTIDIRLFNQPSVNLYRLYKK